ncbi:MAG: hypothetical protein E7620_00420 [Ruminococcaceae bacterium]|nr:hypothetical protein [Oscillospiraceae bacterium]
MNRRLAYILIAAMSLMIVVGIVLSVLYYKSNAGKVVDDLDLSVTIGDQTTTNREFKLEKLIPGSSTEYTMHINAKKQDTYVVTLDFNELKDNGLKSLVNVRLMLGDIPMYEGTLESLLADGTTVTFECAPSDDNKVSMKVIYSMSVDVGNEAMGASADFLVTLTSQAK